jgi:hypothetical protein
MQDLLRERSVGGAKPVNALADRLFVVGAQLGGLQQAEEIVMAAAKELVAESGLSLEEFDLDELEYEEELMLKRAFGRGSNDPVNPFTAGPVTPGL